MLGFRTGFRVSVLVLTMDTTSLRRGSTTELIVDTSSCQRTQARSEPPLHDSLVSVGLNCYLGT